MLELAEARASIESGLAHSAAARAPEEGKDRLRTVSRSLRKARTDSVRREAGARFHRTAAQLIGARFLLPTPPLPDGIYAWAARVQLEVPEACGLTIPRTGASLDAGCANDPARTARAMPAHGVQAHPEMRGARPNPPRARRPKERSARAPMGPGLFRFVNCSRPRRSACGGR